MVFILQNIRNYLQVVDFSLLKINVVWHQGLLFIIKKNISSPLLSTSKILHCQQIVQS